MSDDEPSLSLQLLVHPRFRWREGMRDERGVRLVELDLWDGTDPPDLADPATAGVLLQVLAETGLLTDVVRDAGEWIVAVELPEDGVQGYASDILGEAACYALLQAWDVLPDAIA
ncbi:MAG: hypothetical protein ABMA64_03950 [Myxococcota bacterium]